MGIMVILKNWEYCVNWINKIYKIYNFKSKMLKYIVFSVICYFVKNV